MVRVSPKPGFFAGKLFEMTLCRWCAALLQALALGMMPLTVVLDSLTAEYLSLATDSEGEIFSGQAVEHNRKRHHALRQRLQKRGTPSAKRHLKKLSGKEARFRRNTNHVISKRIVQKAKANGQGIAIEELRHIRKRTDRTVRYSQRSRHSSWAFGQLRFFLQYKAALTGVPLHTVNPRNTSRTCPACGHCAKENRKSQAVFCCVQCSLTMNADIVGAINISRAPFNSPIVAIRALLQA